MIDPALAEYAETPDRFAPIPEGSSVLREDDGRICIIQGPIWASISGAQFDEHELDDVLAHVHDRVAPDKRQTWWIGPTARPANLVALLQERGFVLAPDGPEVRAMVLTTAPPGRPERNRGSPRRDVRRLPRLA